MLPIFNNYTWIIIFMIVMFYVLKDWRKAKDKNGYMTILYVSSFISGICVIDALSRGNFLNQIIPNYMYTLVPFTIVVSITTLFSMNFRDIKNSEQSEDEKRKNYKKQIKYIISLLLACVWLYFSEYIGKYIVGPILTFIGLSK